MKTLLFACFFNAANMDLTWFDHLFFFLLGVVFPAMAVMSEKSGAEEDESYIQQLPPKKHIYYSNGLMLVIGALMVLTLWNVTYRDFGKLGFQEILISPAVLWIVAGITLIYTGDTLYNVWQSKKEADKWKDLSHIMPTSWQDYRHFIFLALAAGSCEEIIFRGFMINYVVEMTSSYSFAEALALIIPAFIFSISHIYQGWASVIKIASISLLFGALYMYTTSLYLVMIIHVLVDLISGAVLVTLSRSK